MKTIKELTHKWLVSHKCDGLSQPDTDCQCCLTDHMCSDYDYEVFDCLAARKLVVGDGVYMFPATINRNKPPVSVREIATSALKPGCSDDWCIPVIMR